MPAHLPSGSGKRFQPAYTILTAFVDQSSSVSFASANQLDSRDSGRANRKYLRFLVAVGSKSCRDCRQCLFFPRSILTKDTTAHIKEFVEVRSTIAVHTRM